MDVYSTDEETVEKLRAWWSENGPWIIGGIALGALALFGWRYWLEWRDQTYAEASQRYESLVAASEAGEYARALELAGEIRDSRLPTPYADLAALVIARQAVQEGDTPEARAQLRGIIDGGGDAHTAHLARLRLARLLLAAGEHDEAAALAAYTDTAGYTPLYAELRGDIALARGDRDGAIAAFRSALDAADDGIADRQLLQMKLNDLGAGAQDA